MADQTYIATLRTLEYVGRIAAKQLAGAFEKQPLWSRKNAGNGKAGVVDTIFSSDKIAAHNGPVDPGQHVIVQRIHLAKGRAHFARFRHQAARQGREGDESLFEINRSEERRVGKEWRG